MNSSLKIAKLNSASSALKLFLTFFTTQYLVPKMAQLIAKANHLICNFARERSLFIWTSHPRG